MWHTFLIYGTRLGKQRRRISGSGQGDHGSTWKSTKNDGSNPKGPGTREHRAFAQAHSERSRNGHPSQPQEDLASRFGASRRKAEPARLKTPCTRLMSSRSAPAGCLLVSGDRTLGLRRLLSKNHADRAVSSAFAGVNPHHVTAQFHGSGPVCAFGLHAHLQL